MKKTIRHKGLLLLISLFIFAISGCDDSGPESDPPDMVIDYFPQSYEGTLVVQFTNTIPEWNVATSMNVSIIKTLGVIEIDSATLSYSGDDIIVPENSRIARSGRWSIDPIADEAGFTSSGYTVLPVNANITVNNDTTRVYGWDDESKTWKLAQEVDTGTQTPNSDLVFNIDDAVLGGSVVSASGTGGSITFTLYLTPTLTDL